MEINKKKEVIRTLKYVLFTASAGLIQLGTTFLLNTIWPYTVFKNGPVLFYLIGLLLSVIWNLTFNRKFTFKSAENMGKAVLLTIAFYIVFTPASLLLQAWLTNGVLIENSTLDFASFGWKSLGFDATIGTIICMLLNFGLEFPYQRFVVFGKSIDQTEKKD